MKKILALVLSALMLLSVVSCGQPADTTEPTVTDAPETDAPETDAPETDAPETEAPETDAPETDAPETDAPEELPSISVPTATEDSLLFNLTFDNVSEMFSELPDGFSTGESNWTLVGGEDGYIQSGIMETGKHSRSVIKDKNLTLLEGNFVVEIEIAFDELPTKRLSVITWQPKVSGNDKFAVAVRLDSDGTVYCNNNSSEIKFEVGKRYTITSLYDIENGEVLVFIDGVFVGTGSLSDYSTATGSSLRILDALSDKPEFSARLYGVKAFYYTAE